MTVGNKKGAKRQLVDTLATSFRALPSAARVRLAAHAEAGTPICCGSSAPLWIDGAGGG